MNKKGNKMQGLFELNIEAPEEVKASKFIGHLQEIGFVDSNMVYLQNYINADIAIAFSHIKNAYKTYVSKGKWSEEKFEDIILVIAKNRKMLIPNTFLQYGIKYDEGKLTSEINAEKRRYKKILNNINAEKSNKTGTKEISKEEQELLDYIAKNGGM